MVKKLHEPTVRVPKLSRLYLYTEFNTNTKSVELIIGKLSSF